jgi:hypothetical protein
MTDWLKPNDAMPNWTPTPPWPDRGRVSGGYCLGAPAMNLIYHRSVQRDVSVVIAYYDQAGGAGLGDAFLAELLSQVQIARAQPTTFHSFQGELRRGDLSRFLYHFLFRCTGNTVRVLVVRHNRRHPDFGIRRR